MRELYSVSVDEKCNYKVVSGLSFVAVCTCSVFEASVLVHYSHKLARLMAVQGMATRQSEIQELDSEGGCWFSRG